MMGEELISKLRDISMGADMSIRHLIREACYRLEAQQARIAQLEAELKEERRWIPVEEGPPKKDGRYLCRYRFGEGSRMTFTHVLDYYATDPVPHFQHTLGDTTMRVTHWKPLPEWPEEF